MNDITYAVSVDVNNPIIPYNVYVANVLDSNVRYLEITLYENGNVVALSNEATATASLVTDDVLIDDSVECTISNNIISVPLEDLQRHGNLDVQVIVTEGTKVLAIPFPIQVRVTPNIAENAQIDENSLGSYAEVVHEITEARGTYTTLHDAIAAKEVKSNKKTTLTGNESSNDYYPTTKAVADALDTKIGSGSFDDSTKINNVIPSNIMDALKRISTALTSLDKDIPVYKTRFSVAQGVEHSSTLDTISVNIQANEKFALRWDSTLPSQYAQIIAFYNDGTTTKLVDAQTQNVSRYTEYTAENNIVKIGVFSTAQSSAYIFELAVATQSIGMEFLDLLKNNTVANQESIVSAQGIVKTEFSVAANTDHTSTLDKRTVDIHVGEEYSIYAKTTFNGNLYMQVFAVYTDDTKERIYGGNVAATGYYGTFTASKAIKTIAYYTVSKTSAYTFTAFVCANTNLKGLLTSMLDSTYASVEYVEELEKSENFRSIKFDVASGVSHSSAIDRLPFSISAGDIYSVHLRFDMENVPFNAYMQVIVTYADGTTARVIEGNYPSIMLSEKLIAAKAIVRFGVYVGSQANDYSCILSVARGQNAVDVFHTVYGERYDLLQTLTDSKVQSFSALYNGSESVDSYIFFTDPHAMPGANVLTKPKLDTLDAYLQTVEEYADAIDADTVLCGGDWLNNGDTQAIACYKLRLLKGLSDKHFSGHNYHMLMGNHDTNYQGKRDSSSAANTGQLTQATLDNLLYADTNTGKAYYRFDTVNTTYFCLDTGLDWSTAMDSYRWEQIAWLCGQLLTTTKANIIITMHIFANQGTVETYTDHITPMATNVISAIEAYNSRETVTLNGQNYNFNTVTGVVRCVLTGHTHFDAVYTTSGGIPVIFTTDATDYATSPVMFDMGFLNYTAGTLSIFRIGEGSDRTITLATLT